MVTHLRPSMYSPYNLRSEVPCHCERSEAIQRLSRGLMTLRNDHHMEVNILAQLDEILHRVARPARYTGGEWNSIIKDWDKTGIRIALSYPDTYEIGMSNIALPILYDLLNSQPDILAERVYAPWVDMEAAMRENGIPLFSLESRRP